MAVYASTVALDCRSSIIIAPGWGMILGTCNVTNYNTTGAEITDITKYFKTIKRVMCDVVSDSQFIIAWNTTDLCFHAYYPLFVTDDNSASTTGTALYFDDDGALGVKVVSTCAGNADAYETLAEVADDTDVGLVSFVAYGYI